MTFLQQIIETSRSLLGGQDAEVEVARTISAWALPGERVGVAIGALRALPDDEAEMVAAAFLEEVRSTPPGFHYDELLGEARAWAGTASAVQVKGYVWALFHALAPGSRLRFLRRVIEDLPAEERARLFSEIWETFDPATRRAFISQVTRGGRQ